MATEHKIVAAYAEDANVALALAKLADEGCRIQQTRNLYGAIAAIAQDPPDAVLVDVDEMGEQDFAFFDELVRFAPHAFCLAMFSPAQRAHATKAMQIAADAYLLKPVRIDEVTSIVLRRLRAGGPAEDSTAGRERLQSLAQLAKGVAHEISNPLTTVSGWLQMLLADTPENDPNHQTFRLMNEETRRIAEVVNGLRTFAEQRPANRRPVSPATLVQQVVAQFKAAHADNGVKVEPTIEDGLPDMEVDDEQMRDAISALLETLAAAGQPNGPIQIRVAGNGGDAVEITVRNPGQVMEGVQVDRVFEPFFMNEGKSLGLGLAIAHGVVENHGGRLTVACSPERGTEFRASLPLSGA